MVSNDTMYVPALLAPHPEWQGAYDQDGPPAVATRRQIIDRVIADKMRSAALISHSPAPDVFAKDATPTPSPQSSNPHRHESQPEHTRRISRENEASFPGTRRSSLASFSRSR